MNKEELRSIVAQAVGQASMCWDPIPSGVFDSSKAVEVVDATVKLVEGLIEEVVWLSPDGHWIRDEDKKLRPDSFDFPTRAVLTITAPVSSTQRN